MSQARAAREARATLSERLTDSDATLLDLSSRGDVLYEDLSFEEPVGRGSYGAVWRCKYQGQEVAVKQCVVGDLRDADMLVSEICYLKHLRHPSLVAFLGCCQKDQHVFMLLEFLPGGSLHDLLFNTRYELELQEKFTMARDVAEGISYLHNLGVIHRDLKTMNIVLNFDLRCKICDFGLSLTLDRTHLTVMALQGSPRYMAPEQFEATARITEKVDIWQMGCVMMELFSLRMPFEDATGVQQIVADLLVHRRPPEMPADADERAGLLVRACFRIHSAARPTAAALAEALWGILHSMRWPAVAQASTLHDDVLVLDVESDARLQMQEPALQPLEACAL